MHPAAQWVFASYRLSGCWNCESSPDETLAEVAAGYGFSLERFLADLNGLPGVERAEARLIEPAG